MTSYPQHNNNNEYLRSARGGMASAPPDGLQHTMTSAPRRYDNTAQPQQQESSNFFKRLIFNWDARELEMELQRLKISKSDLIESSFQKSELGFFNLFFQAIPMINISIIALLLSFIFYVLIAKYSITLAIIASFLFLQLTVFNTAKIMYRLDVHKIGEKATGRFIKIVRGMWHLYEFIYFMILAGVAILYYSPVQWDKVGNKLLSFKFQTPVYQFMWKYLSNFIKEILGGLGNFITGYFLLLLLFAVTYIVATYIVYSKSSKQQKQTKFEMKKEVLNPADLAREKLDF